MRVLVVNTGSSSLKLSVVSEDGKVHTDTTVEHWDGQSGYEPIHEFLETAGALDAVGHRVVHGGPRFREAVQVDADLVAYLESIHDLAPLHNPRAVAAIRVVTDLLPQTPAVACFDTAFHATLPAAAYTYALPRDWNDRWGLRRYGFHGLSHAYAVRRAAELASAALSGSRMVSCHLGAGASLAAVRDGTCLDTTMGFTPLAGLVMVTRSGDVDPGLLLWLLEHGGVSVAELTDALENRSGLKGLSGRSGDLRELLAGRTEGDQDCTLAFDVFVHRLCREIAAMTAAVGGLDVLVLTGGIGEHSPEVRTEVATRLAYLGIEIDPNANGRTDSDADISKPGATARTVVVTAREDVEITQQTISLIRHRPPSSAGSNL